MNRADVIEYVALKNDITRKRAEEIVILIINLTKEELISGGKVQITGFGTFDVKDRMPRIGRNPKTNEVVKIDAYKKPTFSPSAILRELVNKSK